MPIYKDLNRGFFKTWSPEMAYVLGFFAADGTMIANNRGAHFIEFHVTDREILMKIRKVLNSNHKISLRDRRNDKWKLGFRLQIGSKEMFDDLLKLGFSPKKSLIIRLPKIPNNFLGDFVRGYFDGDGCIYFRKHKAKDRKKERWVFATRFTSGSRVFLEEMKNVLKLKGYISRKTGGFELVYSHRSSVALYGLMYHNNCRDLYLNRKHKLFYRALKTLYKLS